MYFHYYTQAVSSPVMILLVGLLVLLALTLALLPSSITVRPRSFSFSLDGSFQVWNWILLWNWFIYFFPLHHPPPDFSLHFFFCWLISFTPLTPLHPPPPSCLRPAFPLYILYFLPPPHSVSTVSCHNRDSVVVETISQAHIGASYSTFIHFHSVVAKKLEWVMQ